MVTQSSPSPGDSSDSGTGGWNFHLQDLLGFENMLTPKIIRLLYYVAIVLITLAGLFTLFSAFTARFGAMGRAVFGLLTLVLGPLLVRIWAEYTIVFFGIYDRLGDIRDRKE